MAILIAGIALLQLAHSANWLSILLAVLLALNVVVFLIAFLYFMLKRPHSLRSESFDYKMSELIQKRAGEMGAGLYEEVSAVSELKVHAASDSQRPEEQNSNE